MQQNHLQQILLRTRQQQAQQQLNPNQAANTTNPAPPTNPAEPIPTLEPVTLSAPTPTQNNDNNNNQNLLLNHRWDNYYINQHLPDLRNRALNLAINLRNFLADNVFGVGVVVPNNDNNRNMVRRRVRMINLRNLQQINLGGIQIIPTNGPPVGQNVEQIAEGVYVARAVRQTPTPAAAAATTVDTPIVDTPAVDTPIVSQNETLDNRSNFQRNFEENNFILTSASENSETNEENVATTPVTIESKSVDDASSNLYYSVAPVAQKDEATNDAKSKVNVVVNDFSENSSINEELNKTIIKTTNDKIEFDEFSSKEINSSLNDNWGNCNSSIDGNSCRSIVPDEHKISSETNELKVEDPGDEN